MNIHSKEDIKDRMYKNAASFWGIRNIDNLDPMVKLLIEAFANEIYRLSNELNSIETRILERTANLLTPDILMSVRPAHMIVQAYPTEDKGMVDRLTGFYYDNPTFNLQNKTRNLSFFPADAFSLIKGQVKALVCGRTIYTYDNFHNKEILAKSNRRAEVFTNNLWIGLDLEESVDSIENLSFFFDFINIESKFEYLHMLPYTNWQYKGDRLSVSQGIHRLRESSDGRNVFTEYDLANIYDDGVVKSYDYQYVTLADKIKVMPSDLKNLPEEVSPYFDETVAGHIGKPLFWLKVSFPPNFNEDVLESVSVAINAFPVINKDLVKLYIKTNKLTNIIPLHSESKEFFLCVNDVTDSHGKVYSQLPFQDTNRHKSGTYVVKRGGVERFDSRNAKDYIHNLIDLLRDEGVAYSIVGKGFLGGLTKQLEELIAVMDLRIAEVNESKEISSYMILDSESIDELIFINYWITQGEIANTISAGASLTPYTDTLVVSTRAISLTHAIGGRGTPKSSSVLDMYKYILTSRDRIYTTEDIINFCHSGYGEVISNVEVKKGVQISSKPLEGLIRTIDVFVTMSAKRNKLPENYSIKDELYNQLKSKSPDTFNYRVFVK